MTLENLSASKKKVLRQILAEIKARDIDIPENAKDKLFGVIPEIKWPIDSNGYFLKNDGSFYNPLPIHTKFLESRALFLALVGGRGVGKSAVGSQKCMLKIKEGKSGVVMNPDFENFKISTWPELREWIPWDAVVPKHRHRRNPEWFPSQPFVIAFNHGPWMLCKGLRDPESARGPNVNWFWYDEGGRDDTGDGFRIAVPSVRIGKAPQIWVTGTPNGDDHWMSKFFIDEEVPEETYEILEDVAKDRVLIETLRGSTMDNKDNLEPETLAFIIAQYPEGWLKEQEIYGKIVKQGIGALGNPSWFDNKVISQPPQNVHKRVRYWDLAATEKKAVSKKRYDDPDETVGTRASCKKEKIEEKEEKEFRFYIEDQKSGHWEWDDILENIKNTALEDGPYVEIWVEQEPAAGGKNQIAAIRNYIRDELPGWPQVKGHNPRELGDKVMRANFWFSEADQGFIYLVVGSWIKLFLRQLSSFPGKHDDKIDSVSGARAVLAPIGKWKTIPFLKVGTPIRNEHKRPGISRL